MLSFLGFDIMTTLAEETIEARKVVSRAVVLVIPIITFFFVTQTYLAAVIHPGYNFDNPDVAFFYIAEEAGGRWLQVLTMLGKRCSPGALVILLQPRQEYQECFSRWVDRVTSSFIFTTMKL